MLKRVIIIFLLFCFSIANVAFTESQFKFDRWPVGEFNKNSIIKDYGNSHFGLDIQAPEGVPVYAPVSGTVYWTYSGGSHGISIGIEHKSGIRMTFLHLSERLVKKGQIVESGQIIGRVGMTGSGRDSEPAHLHFAVIINADAPVTKPEERYANPLDFLPVTAAVEEQTPPETAAAPTAQPSETTSPNTEIPTEVPQPNEPVISQPAQQPAGQVSEQKNSSPDSNQIDCDINASPVVLQETNQNTVKQQIAKTLPVTQIHKQAKTKKIFMNNKKISKKSNSSAPNKIEQSLSKSVNTNKTKVESIKPVNKTKIEKTKPVNSLAIKPHKKVNPAKTRSLSKKKQNQKPNINFHPVTNTTPQLLQKKVINSKKVTKTAFKISLLIILSGIGLSYYLRNINLNNLKLTKNLYIKPITART